MYHDNRSSSPSFARSCLLSLSLIATVLTGIAVDVHAVPLRRVRIPAIPDGRPALSIATRGNSVSSRSTTTTATSESTPSVTTTSTEQSNATPSPGGTGMSSKLVVAHHMVGNTFPYTKQDWLDDIVLAHKWGIDGFALNTGKDVDWEPARIDDAYTAAQDSGLDFKLFLSLDMASLPCSAPEHAAYIRNLTLAHADHPNQLKHDSRIFVSTFAGENCRFGLDDSSGASDAWATQFTQHPDIQGRVYFVPSFFVDPATFGKFGGVMDGDFNWNSGWPVQVTTDFAKDVLKKLSVNGPQRVAHEDEGVHLTGSGQDIVGLQEALGALIGSMESDNVHLSALQALTGGSAIKRDGTTASKPVYMASVSPWFFTHYGADSLNKNFMFLADQHLYVKRWESLVQSRDQLHIVQILTWNDYGESHYIGPIKGDQPDSEAWTDGMDHTAWLELTKYYANAFKTGEFPKIEKDQIYMWSRPHPANAQAQDDPLGQPKNFELTEDTVWVVVMTTAPSQVKLSTGGSESTHDVPAGVSKLAMPITPGGTMRGVIERDGKTVVELAPTGDEFTFQGSPKTYNFNAFVARAVAEL